MKSLLRFSNLILFIAFSFSPALATMQGPEIVIFNSKSYAVYDTCPLAAFYKRNKDWPSFRITDTAHYRGYTGTWEINGERLYLTHIDAWIERRFMKSSLYERNTILRIESGKMVGIEIVDNTKNTGQRALNAELFEAMENADIPKMRALLENGAGARA